MKETINNYQKYSWHKDFSHYLYNLNPPHDPDDRYPIPIPLTSIIIMMYAAGMIELLTRTGRSTSLLTSDISDNILVHLFRIHIGSHRV